MIIMSLFISNFISIKHKINLGKDKNMKYAHVLKLMSWITNTLSVCFFHIKFSYKYTIDNSNTKNNNAWLHVNQIWVGYANMEFFNCNHLCLKKFMSGGGGGAGRSEEHT